MTRKVNKKLFPKLDIFSAITGNLTVDYSYILSKTVIICVQHLLETTGSLIEAMIEAGINPENVYLTGKAYSTNTDVYNKLCDLNINALPSSVSQNRGEYSGQLTKDVIELWSMLSKQLLSKRCISNIIILDDGGYAIRNVPHHLSDKYNVIGIEQTTSGIKYNTYNKIPIIDVASSASKKLIEPHVIVETIINKTSTIIANDIKYGVIGLGNIGAQLVNQLDAMGHAVNVYDKANINADMASRFACYDNVLDLINYSDIIFGCTGDDVTVNLDINEIISDKILLSCSSSDIEFNTLLHITNTSKLCNSPRDVFDDIIIHANKSYITILRGGFPVNFDKTKESVPAIDIQLTRGLLFAGILQAVNLLKSGNQISGDKIILEPILQQKITKAWFDLNPARINDYEKVTTECFDSLPTIIDKSI